MNTEEYNPGLPIVENIIINENIDKLYYDESYVINKEKHTTNKNLQKLAEVNSNRREAILKTIYRAIYASIDKSHNNSDFYCYMGNVQSLLSNVHRSLFAYKRAIYWNPKNIDALNERNRIEILMNVVLDKLELDTVFLDNYINDNDYQYSIPDKLQSVPQAPVSRAIYDQCIQVIKTSLYNTIYCLKAYYKKNKNLSTLIQLSYNELFLGKLETSYKIIKQAENLYGKKYEILFLLLYLNVITENYDEAIKYVESIREKHPGKIQRVFKLTRTIVSRVDKHLDISSYLRDFVDEVYKRKKFLLKKYSNEFKLANIQVRIIQKYNMYRGIPPIIISAIPKSGSSLLDQIFAKGLNISSVGITVWSTDSYKNITTYPIKRAIKRFAKGGVMCRQHFLPTKELLEVLKYYNIKKILIHVREPRQAMISRLFYQESLMLEYHQFLNTRFLPEEYPLLNLEKRVDIFIDTWLRFINYYIESWLQIKENTNFFDIKFSTFEDMIKDKHGFIEDIMEFFEIPDIKIKGLNKNAITKKRKGENFEWMTLFTEKQRENASAIISDNVKKYFNYPDF